MSTKESVLKDWTGVNENITCHISFGSCGSPLAPSILLFVSSKISVTIEIRECTPNLHSLVGGTRRRCQHQNKVNLFVFHYMKLHARSKCCKQLLHSLHFFPLFLELLSIPIFSRSIMRLQIIILPRGYWHLFLNNDF